MNTLPTQMDLERYEEESLVLKRALSPYFVIEGTGAEGVVELLPVSCDVSALVRDIEGQLSGQQVAQELRRVAGLYEQVASRVAQEIDTLYRSWE